MAKVMLVEDDNNLREIYEARLAAEGYTIASARDGEEALVLAKSEKPDLIISDVMMPKISGFEMLDILRNTDGLKETKVIMLTALGQSDDRTRADSLGADRYLVKSQVTLEDIVKAAHELLEPQAATTPSTAAAATDEVTSTTATAPSPAPTTPYDPTESAAPASVSPLPVTTAPAAPVTPAPTTPADTPSVTPMTATDSTPSTAAPTDSNLNTPAPVAPVLPIDSPDKEVVDEASEDTPAVSTPPASDSTVAAPVPAPSPEDETPQDNPVSNPATPEIPPVPDLSVPPVADTPATSEAPAVVEASADAKVESSSTSEEQSAVESQIEDFIKEHSNAESTSATKPDTEAAAAPPTSSDTTDATAPSRNTIPDDTKDTAMNDAVNQLIASAEPAFSSDVKAEEVTPSTAPADNLVSDESAPQVAADQPEAEVVKPTEEVKQGSDYSGNDAVTVAHKKVIKPLGNLNNKPNLDELLAKEEAKAFITEQAAAAASTPPEPPIETPPASPESTDTSVTSSPQPGNTFSPGQTSPAATDTSSPELKKNDGFDPNSISL